MKRLLFVVLFAAACFAQTGTTAPSAGPVVGILNYIHAVDSLDTTLAFYNDVFGLKGEPRPFPNPGVPALTNSPGVSLRLAVLKLPNAGFGFELTQFSGVDRHPGRAKHTDPGAGLLALRVKDMAPVLAAIKKRNDPIVTSSGAPVTIATPRGEIHSLLVQDPDGYFVEVVQSAPPASVTSEGNVYDVSVGLTIADRESTLKFYHDLLGFDLKGKPDFSNDPIIADLVGAPHVQSRELVATIPGTKALWAFYEYKGVERKPFHLRVPDPGAPAVALRVQDLDGLLKRMRAAGVEVTSLRGEVVQFSPTIRNIFVTDPNGLNIELFESRAAEAQQPGAQPAAPPLMACGVHGDIEVLCGTRSPEDLELTPDSKYLIATQFLNLGRAGSAGAGMALYDLAKKTFSKMAVTDEPDKSWGDPACPGPIGDALVSHGESLAKRSNGAWALYVVNHGGRQSIEMFELKPAAGSWALVWRGCEVAAHDYNDVAILPDGGFVGTYPTALSSGGTAGPFGGAVTGYVARWTPGKGESEIMNTRIRYPNGVVVSADGRFMYLNEFSAGQVHKYDLKKDKLIGTVKVDFLPDNLTWTKEGRLLAAGVKGARGDCPEGSGRPCIQGFGVAEIDPAKMQSRVIFDSATHDPLIGGVSVALEVGNSIYLGAFQGDRLVKIPYPK